MDKIPAAMTQVRAERIEELKRRLAAAELGGGAGPHRQAARGGQAHRPRAHRAAARRRLLRGDRRARHPPLPRLRHGRQVTIPGDGVVCGYGTVDGRLVYVFAQDFTVFGGSLSETNAAKICKVMDLAVKNGAPVIGLNDSGGARIQEGVASLGGYADIFLRNTLASGVVPQISAIMGPCAGGAVYSPAITDFIFMVEETSYMFVTGPDVIKTVTHEEVTKEELGGAIDAQRRRAASATSRCPTTPPAWPLIRELLSYLPQQQPRRAAARAPATTTPNREDAALDTLVPEDPNKPYDIKQLIADVVDDGKFFEVHAHYAPQHRGRLRAHRQPQRGHRGQPAGLSGRRAGHRRLAQGGALRALLRRLQHPARHLRGRARASCPAPQQEFGGIIRHGAKLLYAYAEATVPKITVITRKAYGGAYCVMASKHLRTDVNFAYPTAEIAVMGPEGAVNILYRRELDEAGADAAAVRAEKVAEYRAKFANPYIAAERGFVDAIIEPRRTRPEIVRALRQLGAKRASLPPKKHGNIPL